MKHTNIGTILGWTEIPETTEGLFLQPEEALRIDTALGKISENETAATDLVTANTTIGEQTTKITNLETAAANHEGTVTGLNNRITELETQLGLKASGNGSTLKVAADEAEEIETKVGKLPRYDSPDHPANLAAKRRGIK